MNTLAPWLTTQRAQLTAQRGHAWLLQGPSGLGQYVLALELASFWLCESPQPAESQAGQGAVACGQCPSCHLIAARTHPDLAVLMPESVALELGWPLADKVQRELDEKKRKPSREIRVDAMRDAIEFSQRTSARGRGKALLVYPAERMNAVTANALLKTLEEPPGDMRFVLATEAVHQLLPTVRSRCQSHSLLWPDASAALDWLVEQGLNRSDAEVWLRAAGGRPDDALALAASGLGVPQWRHFPKAIARGDVLAMDGWEPPRLVNALQKLCHDLWAQRCGAGTRFFDAADLPAAPSAKILARWSKALAQIARSVDHPYNPGLMREALVSQAHSALHLKT